jgi:hypothetical protein
MLGRPRQRLRSWWQARHPRTDTWTLTQRNIYIVPTRAGFVFAAVLVVMLVASINYQLNLGYVLTFLLAGAGFVSMHLTHNTLRGLTLHLKPPQSGFAAESLPLEVVLTSPTRLQHGVGLGFADNADRAHDVFVDVPAGGQASAHLAFVPPRRGLNDVPTLRAETYYPFGLFRAWTVWRPAAQVLAWPAPERPMAPLPASPAAAGETAQRKASDSGEFEGVRSYRRGDALKHVVWEKSRAHRRAGQPRSQQCLAAGAVARLAARASGRHGAAAVALGSLGAGGGERRGGAWPALAGCRDRAGQRECAAAAQSGCVGDVGVSGAAVKTRSVARAIPTQHAV